MRPPSQHLRTHPGRTNVLAFLLLGGGIAGLGASATFVAALPTVPPGFTVEQVASGFHQPISIAFLPDGRVLFTERGTGQVHLIANDVVSPVPVADFATNFCRERGLIGIAVSPAFKQDSLVYVFFSQSSTTTDTFASTAIVDNRVVKFRLRGDTMLAGSAVVVRSLPTLPDHCAHISGNLHFALDGSLLVSYGDGEYDPSPSLDLSSERGKLLRLDPATGNGYPDNPFADDGDPATLDDIWAYGLRNTFDFTIDRQTGQVFGTENSDGTEDEVNWLVAGGNYGWPRVEGPADLPDEIAYADSQANYHEPIWNSGPTTVCPTGIVVADSNRFGGSLGRSLLVAECNPPYKIVRFPVGGLDGATVTGPTEDWATGFPYSVIDLEWDPQGRLWISSFPDPGFLYRVSYTATLAVPPGPSARLALAHAGQHPARGGAAVRATIPPGPAGRLSVFDAVGRRVRVLAESLPSGEATTVSWDGRDDGGRSVHAGCFFVRLVQGGARATLPVILLE
jgi:glucose/arabinose dehydrogenase